MRSYVTLFDRNYLYQGVALYQSLEKHSQSAFQLYAICMDDLAFETLQKLDRKNFIPIRYTDFDTPETVAVRARTTHGQYCWTCQPLSCLYLLERFGLDRITYLEADSLFFADPEILFQELGENSVSLIAHRYSPQFDQTATSGKFCVQFNSFANNDNGRAVLNYWKKECFRYDKSRPTDFPGQTCLDQWESRFKSVKELQHLGGGVAPWNVQQYSISRSESGILVNGVPLVFYHFHAYGQYKDGSHELGGYPLSQNVVNLVYRPYAEAIRHAEAWVHQASPSFDYRKYIEKPRKLRARVSFHLRRLRGTWNVYKSL